MADEREVRLRLIEAAAKSPMPHDHGYAAGVLAAAQGWAAWVFGTEVKRETLHAKPK